MALGQTLSDYVGRSSPTRSQTPHPVVLDTVKTIYAISLDPVTLRHTNPSTGMTDYMAAYLPRVAIDQSGTCGWRDFLPLAQGTCSDIAWESHPADWSYEEHPEGPLNDHLQPGTEFYAPDILRTTYRCKADESVGEILKYMGVYLRDKVQAQIDDYECDPNDVSASEWSVSIGNPLFPGSEYWLQSDDPFYQKLLVFDYPRSTALVISSTDHRRTHPFVDPGKVQSSTDLCIAYSARSGGQHTFFPVIQLNTDVQGQKRVKQNRTQAYIRGARMDSRSSIARANAECRMMSQDRSKWAPIFCRALKQYGDLENEHRSDALSQAVQAAMRTQAHITQLRSAVDELGLESGEWTGSDD